MTSLYCTLDSWSAEEWAAMLKRYVIQYAGFSLNLLLIRLAAQVLR